jgi:hypothetical protein
MIVEELLKQAEEELATLTEEELELFADGWDNRGMDCVTERWYLPDRLQGGAIGKIAGCFGQLKELLRNKAYEHDLT